MKQLDLEIKKITRRKLGLLLFFFNLIALPSIILGLILFNENGIEGNYIDNVAYSVLAFTLAYLFLPLWIIVLTGLEYNNGHLHRIVFLTSRKFYFLSKVTFSILTAFLFSIIGLIALATAKVFSPHPFLVIPIIFYFKFFCQCFITFLSFSLFFLSLIILIRNIVVTYIVYFFLFFIEGVAFKIGEAKFGIKMYYLPHHLLNSLFTIDGQLASDNYFMLFERWSNSYILLILFLCIFLFVAYKSFMNRSLPSLSD